MKTLLSLACAALFLLVSGPARPANVYRCPDGSYADKPCGQGQKVVATTRRSSGGSDITRSCVAVGDEAEKVAKRKAAGLSAADALKAVDNEYIPFEEKAARKKFVVQVYRAPGSPAEVRSVMEADCVAEKKATAEKAAAEKAAADRAAADRAAAEKAAAARTADATAGQTGASPAAGLSKEQCKKLRKDMEAMKRSRAEAEALFEGGEGSPAPKDGGKDEFAALCAN